MNKWQRAVKSLSENQMKTYEQICELKHIRAEGPAKRSCRVLLKLGLIKHNPESDNKNDYLLDGPPVKASIKTKLPSPKKVIDAILGAPAPQRPWDVINETIEEKAKQKIQRPRADHTNLSREDHIHKWLSLTIEIGVKAMVKLKHLNDDQMLYIMQNFEQKTAQQLADHLKVEKFMVKLFCQANNIDPMAPAKKTNYGKRDAYHLVPQKKTA